MFRNTHYNDGGVYIQGKFALRSFEDSWKFDNQMASWLNLNEEGGAKYNCVWYPEKDYKGTPHIMTYNHKNVLLKQEINTASSVKCE
ncbi:hypothetical protein SAMN05216174_104358 [Actinokineospora iranica]|uniref:Uncharacterized protein n=2 Tax=Actinokineospora iranica TaxID=1271860 RepID=A0A1G6PNH4_9PSEU|nr:hypothetical protein SAMN05216174_104358 [Actinokineospora iranica]